VSKITLTRIVISIASLMLAIAALIFVASLVARTGPSQRISLGGFAWVIPVVAGVTVGLLGWLLLSDARRSEFDTRRASEEQGCPSCGRRVMRNWRLCPYCGSFIESEEPKSAAGYAPVER